MPIPTSKEIKSLQNQKFTSDNPTPTLDINSDDVRVRALFDIWSFFDLIDFKGGSSNFGECHHQFTDLVCKPQNNFNFLPTRRMLLAPRGHLKAQPLDTPILTPKGWIKLEKLSVGDEVIGSNGKPTKITHLHPISVMPLFEVSTTDGRKTRCNGNHLWLAESADWVKPRVIDTYELKKKCRVYRKKSNRNKEGFERKVNIKNVEFQGQEQEFLVDPYTLGIWLGDGTTAVSHVTCHDDDTEIFSYSHRDWKKSGKTKYRWTTKRLICDLRKIGASHKDYIPKEYLLASVEQRLELLRGLMDTDGTCHHKQGCAVFNNTSKFLVDLVTELVRSLGGETRVSYTVNDFKGSYNVRVKLKYNPFNLYRKAKQYKFPKKAAHIKVDNVVEVKPAKARCITVENSDGIYITENYIPTHNSTLSSVGYCLWRIYRNPEIRICVATATKDLAEQFVKEVKQYFEDNDLQEEVWNYRPHIDGALIPILDRGFKDSRRRAKWELGTFTEAADKKVIWRSNAIQVLREEIYKEPTLQSTSPGGNITGQHYDLLILDDVINDDTTATPEKIDKTLMWYQDLEAVLNNPPNLVKFGEIDSQPIYEYLGDETLVLGTRYARGDLYEHIEENKLDYEFETAIYKVFKENGEPLWHEKYTKEDIEKLKRRIGRRFYGQYNNEIIIAEEQILKFDQLQYIANPNITFREGDRHVRVNIDGTMFDIYPIIAVDPAISKKKTADNTAICVGGYTENGDLIIIDYVYGKFNPSELADNLFRLCDKWGRNVAHIETVSFQQSIIHAIKQMFHVYRPISLIEYKPKGDKKGRISLWLEPLFNNNKIWLPSKASKDSELKDEIEFFPKEQVKDDIIDVFAMLAQIGNPNGREVKPVNKKKFKRRVGYNKIYGGSF